MTSTPTVVTTQAEYDAALAALDGRPGLIEIRSPRGVWLSVRDTGSATVRASGSATVRAWGSATVEAWGSATVRAWGSATVEAWGSATVRASGSATVRASDAASVEAWDKSKTTATPHVAVHLHSARATVEGGVVIDVIDVTEVDRTADAWLEHHGIAVYAEDAEKRTAILYKAVDDDWRSGWGFRYEPGTDVKAADWRDDGECGHGLHLSPRPVHAKSYHGSATRYLACVVDVDKIRVLSGSGAPKCKVPELRVLHEVDLDGAPVARDAEAVTR